MVSPKYIVVTVPREYSELHQELDEASRKRYRKKLDFPGAGAQDPYVLFKSSSSDRKAAFPAVEFQIQSIILVIRTSTFDLFRSQ